jgi:protein-disulfide isomerase
MAVHQAPVTSPEEQPEAEKPKKTDYFELKIPRPIFTDIAFSPLLIIILVAIAFLLGMQTARIAYMDKELARLEKVAGAQAIGQVESAQPQLGEKVDVDTGKLPVLGSKNAKITMVEFSDFQCPFCKQFYDQTFKQIKKDYIDTGKVRFAFRHDPLPIHPNAPMASEASECANDQKKFWEYHNGLFDQFDSWANETPENLPTKLTTIAEKIGIDTQKFTECLNSGKHTEAVKADEAVGQTIGATATPTFYINGQILVGALPYETFKTILDEELAK